MATFPSLHRATMPTLSTHVILIVIVKLRTQSLVMRVMLNGEDLYVIMLSVNIVIMLSVYIVIMLSVYIVIMS